ncbi:hypothetical protein [Geobacter sp. DSM 9736]|uniref:hypothetical protein n=1 Tax=Geobacter sp. DSM 9736 TaxID=1277350 RepID=UPI000B503357|nr:hypothetical protein [Geobacter sp. DSM 9736]SNB45253.1 hypothetical protein SAMN06269301_0657 [Geobacter sp. DSM 9736]
MGRSCIHFSCRYCGEQVICIDARLNSEDLLTCSKGHPYLLTEEQREKINLAFKGFVEARIDLFI